MRAPALFMFQACNTVRRPTMECKLMDCSRSLQPLRGKKTLQMEGDLRVDSAEESKNTTIMESFKPVWNLIG